MKTLIFIILLTLPLIASERVIEKKKVHDNYVIVTQCLDKLAKRDLVITTYKTYRVSADIYYLNTEREEFKRLTPSKIIRRYPSYIVRVK